MPPARPDLGVKTKAPSRQSHGWEILAPLQPLQTASPTPRPCHYPNSPARPDSSTGSDPREVVRLTVTRNLHQFSGVPLPTYGVWESAAVETRSSRGSPIWLLLLGTLGAIVGFSASERDYVSATILAATALAGSWGYYVGALRLIGCLGSLLFAYCCGPTVGCWIAQVITRQLEISPVLTPWLALAVGGGVVWVLAQVVVRAVCRHWLAERPHMESANRMLGFAVGGAQGTAFMVLLLGGILVAEPHARQRLATAAPNHGDTFARSVAQRVSEITDQIQRSVLGSYVVRWNPMAKVRQLQGLQRAAIVISDPDELRALAHSAQTTSFGK